MKKVLVTLTALAAVALPIVALVPAGTVLASSKTQADVGTLAGAESKVLGVLKGYRDTSGWKAEFNATVDAQTADLSDVQSDLGGSLFSQSGSGEQTTTPFNVPSSAGGWHVDWSYNCSNFEGDKGSFTFFIFQGATEDLTDAGPNQLGSKNSGVEHYYDTGTLHLSIDSECDWKVDVLAGV